MCARVMSSPMSAMWRGRLSEGAAAAGRAARRAVHGGRGGPSQAEALAEFMHSRSTLVLTGAGVSTRSGLPDYRGRNGSYRRGHRPVQHATFVRSEEARQRYWARSVLGWRAFKKAAPNDAHRAIADMQQMGFVDRVLTQNVDGLHEAAGSEGVIALHGRNDRVRCMDCDMHFPREVFQSNIEHANPDWVEFAAAHEEKSLLMRADGDAEVESFGLDYKSFAIPPCPTCGGLVKTDVVFFGDTVPRGLVQQAYDALDRSDALLVCGTSLQVFSAFRFVKHAARTGKPIAVLNQGPTRLEDDKQRERHADVSVQLRLDAECAQVLPVVRSLLAGSQSQQQQQQQQQQQPYPQEML